MTYNPTQGNRHIQQQQWQQQHSNSRSTSTTKFPHNSTIEAAVVASSVVEAAYLEVTQQ